MMLKFDPMWTVGAIFCCTITLFCAAYTLPGCGPCGNNSQSSSIEVFNKIVLYDANNKIQGEWLVPDNVLIMTGRGRVLNWKDAETGERIKVSIPDNFRYTIEPVSIEKEKNPSEPSQLNYPFTITED